MKHPKEPKVLRSVIIENAQEVFSKFGLRKTTMDDIAQTVNKAKGALYYYFRSKEDVYEAVIEKEASLFRIEINEAVENQHCPQAKLKAYVITRMKLFQKLANFYTAFRKEYIENYSFIQKIRKKYDEEELEIITKILSEGVEKHRLVITDIHITALAILTAMKGFEYAWSLETDLNSLENQVDSLLNILFNGLNER